MGLRGGSFRQRRSPRRRVDRRWLDRRRVSRHFLPHLEHA
jgi:hypothetical protein